MKKIILLVLLVTSFANAQEKNLIKVNPLGVLFGSYSLGYERAIADKQSVQLTLALVDQEIFGLETSGGGAELAYRYYFQDKDAFEGWFVSPTIGFSSLEISFNADDSFFSTVDFNGIELDSDSVNTTVFGVSALGGYQWNWQPITLELYTGLNFANYTIEDESTAETGLALGFTMGFAF